MIITIDFESYYSATYTLKHLTTESYLRDPRFEVIGCGVSLNGKPARWYPQPEVQQVLESLPWSTSSLLAFNTAFDGAILAWHYNLYPALYLDAQGMARALGLTYRGASLDAITKLMGLGTKGDYVVAAKGKHYQDFTPEELMQYGSYCCNDVDLTVKMYRELKPRFPSSEALIQSHNLRLFIEPLLTFDSKTLKDHHDDVVKQKQEKILRAMELVGVDPAAVDPEEALRAKLASNPQFAEVLKVLGVEPPKKLSPKTGKETFAFAKTDPEFVELLEHDDVAVQAVVAARLDIRSTIEQTRAMTFMDLATRGAIPIQYNYYGANTSRFSGAGSCNFQNLRRGGKLRNAICPPAGHYIISGDFKQIECRVLNYLAEQDDVVNSFLLHDQGLGPDVYTLFAEKIYRRKLTEEDKSLRMVGKIGELSLGYSAGSKAFKRMLFVQAKGMVISENDAQGVVDIYRQSHGRVRDLWKQGDVALASMLRGVDFDLGRPGMVKGTAQGIRLPNGLYLCYPELRQEWNEERKATVFAYTNRNKPIIIYGSVIIQNICEALARLVLTNAWLRLADRMHIVMHQHDELAAVVPYAEVDRALELMAEEMARPVEWAPDLPIACDVKAGLNYGESRS